MAIDEAILEAVGRGDAPPTLRLFRWDPACLSLGYAQPVADADMDRIAAHSWGIVRRMTGGRAILHTDELTYSVALPIDHPLVAGTIIDSYRRLSAALLTAVQSIGLDVHADKRADRTAKTVGPVCFEVPSDYEITADGKKLIGSAQVRKHNGALQHGSLPLYGDLTRICDALVFPDEATRRNARARVTRRATTLSEALDRTITWEQAGLAVVDAFASTFELELQESLLSQVEANRALELRSTRYAHDSWTLKV
jgi:lipoate-protein ligase A